MIQKETLIAEIFEEIFNTNVCGNDPLKVKRDINKTNLDAEIFIIAEALAPNQARLSGVNYFTTEGNIGSTGKNLEKFLNKLGATVYPDKKNCVYHTEIVHSFPGHAPKNGKKSIRRPNQKEIDLSVKSGILQREIEIIKPKIILLMGNTAYTTFYKNFLNINPQPLTKEIERISKTSKYYSYKEIPVFPIQHASGANPRFAQMINNDKLISMIQSFLG